MIESIKFSNFKSLRDTILPLRPFTLILGANATGKTTALQAFQLIQGSLESEFKKFLSFTALNESEIHLKVLSKGKQLLLETEIIWTRGNRIVRHDKPLDPPSFDETSLAPNIILLQQDQDQLIRNLNGFQNYNLNATCISRPVLLKPYLKLMNDGSNLAGIWDNLRDVEPEKFEALNQELNRWLPEFDRILFETPSDGSRSFLLRLKSGKHKIPASELSQGTLFTLVFVTLAYLPNPPSILGIEEPDRGLHPRLIPELQNALYRLSYPELFGESRSPIQIVATTHSPYFLSLFKNRAEEVVIAHKENAEVKFSKLSEYGNCKEIFSVFQAEGFWKNGVFQNKVESFQI